MARREITNPPAGSVTTPESVGGANKAELPPAARRALAEAKARRTVSTGLKSAATEIGGPGGPEPTRFGDWEVDGIASDF